MKTPAPVWRAEEVRDRNEKLTFTKPRVAAHLCLAFTTANDDVVCSFGVCVDLNLRDASRASVVLCVLLSSSSALVSPLTCVAQHGARMVKLHILVV